MKQLVASGGKAKLADTPEPGLGPEQTNRALVKLRYSAISPGTELGLLNNPHTPDGFALGYSAAGEVVEIGPEVATLRKGDLVACYGSPYVYHGELLSVPERLCVKLASAERLREGAFVGLGAIAIHSVRRMNLQFGETVWNVGLGLLGQLIARVCANANYRVFATDKNEQRVELAQRSGIRDAYTADDARLDERMQAYTGGCGFDAVSLNAHTKREGMLDMCLDRLAFRGVLSIVGNVPTAFDREKLFRKEADIVIARAGGPGRYDATYEEKGVDYPQGYVRWTEARNMAEYVRQLEAGLLNVSSYITHEIELERAAEGYEMLRHERGVALGVVIRYGS
ncbi:MULTISPECIES: zinc-binding alcohol dehydrogenase [unclassified Paenibacillus]|uniref:zinc-dependent alcohol dehydrogenase n=1 Tax=unclassified Paenibacillus TaxID=185978 RepID=UPI001C0F4F3E|nr:MULTISPECIES: zinc-binding alcohol dehydrogenase [unclassified Paenibacillus]MBU5442887.1 zinc-binding alcohol dehydrogenase [Paenibacillus sp. MSJ-34]CAH0119201.1 L-threonine 3-dehydrogenase [Paenibacillus sp. CECT 9249]